MVVPVAQAAGQGFLDQGAEALVDLAVETIVLLEPDAARGVGRIVRAGVWGEPEIEYRLGV